MMRATPHTLVTPLLVLLLAGCLTGERELHDLRAGPLWGPSDVYFIHPGETTREEVLLRLGQPFWTTREDRVLVYPWIHTDFGSITMIPLNSWKATFFLVDHDESGRVVRSGFYEKSGRVKADATYWDLAHDAVDEWLALPAAPEE